MTIDPVDLKASYSEMRQTKHRAGWLRGMTAIVAAFALLFHIAVMSFGAGRLPDLSDEAAQIHAHHVASADDHGADLPKKNAGHKTPCCILSICGLPLPSTDYVIAFLPHREASAPVYGLVQRTALPRTSLFLPVGARAPPVLV